MNPVIISLFLVSGGFLGMILCMKFGRARGLRAIQQDPRWSNNASLVDGAIFALFGLLIAFTFSSAGSRFDLRRQLIVQETNAIGTAYLRLDLLPPADRTSLQALFRDYLDSRIRTTTAGNDLQDVYAELEHTGTLQAEIWKRAVIAISRSSVPPGTAILLMPALNEMFDIVTSRIRAAKTHTPPLIYAFLIAVAFGCSILVGYNTADHKNLYTVRTIGFALITMLSLMVILDLEFPRFGLIRLDSSDQAMTDLRKTLTPP
jgi:hypothetical protein